MKILSDQFCHFLAIKRLIDTLTKLTKVGNGVLSVLSVSGLIHFRLILYRLITSSGQSIFVLGLVISLLSEQVFDNKPDIVP